VERKNEDLKLVRVIYIDEAGASIEEPVFTWASAIVKDTVWLRVERKANDIIETLVPEELRPDFEFHAYDIFSGNNNWSRWRNREGKALRFEILRRFVGLIPKYKLPITECSWQRGADRDALLAEMLQGMAFSMCVDFVERWFTQHAKRDVGMLIADEQGEPRNEPKYKLEIRRSRKSIRAQGLFRRLHHIVDAIHFAGSQESIGLQLADACAFFIKRHHVGKAKDEAEEFYELIRPFIFQTTLIKSMGTVEAKKK
jgi:hypothetical protein